jgi:hypothetical protein
MKEEVFHEVDIWTDAAAGFALDWRRGIAKPQAANCV